MTSANRVQLRVAEHENLAQFPMQAEFYSLIRNCNSTRFHADFSQNAKARIAPRDAGMTVDQDTTQTCRYSAR
jgi:hypothetical protein